MCVCVGGEGEGTSQAMSSSPVMGLALWRSVEVAVAIVTCVGCGVWNKVGAEAVIGGAGSSHPQREPKTPCQCGTVAIMMAHGQRPRTGTPVAAGDGCVLQPGYRWKVRRNKNLSAGMSAIRKHHMNWSRGG